MKTEMESVILLMISVITTMMGSPMARIVTGPGPKMVRDTREGMETWLPQTSSGTDTIFASVNSAAAYAMEKVLKAWATGAAADETQRGE